MDMFTRFNRKNIDDRQIDTLIGLSKGIIADQRVDQAESEFLLSWLVQSSQLTESPIVLNLLEKVSLMLEDGVLDDEESKELLATLRMIAGGASEVGELAKTMSLPVNNPQPDIFFQNRTFLFTGTCVFGTRKQCHAATESLGGRVAKSVTKGLDYLVLGTYVTDSWAHESFGRKIEKAMEYRANGLPLAIVTEEHWVNSGGLM